jgi:hypothetical protein
VRLTQTLRLQIHLAGILATHLAMGGFLAGPQKYLGINLLLTRSRHVHTLSMYMIKFLEEKWQRQLLNELWSKQL